MIKTFIQRLIRNLAPTVFKPDPYTPGLLYLTLSAIQREIGGICPWDTGEECLKNQYAFWSSPCRNFNCQIYRSPTGLIAYTSRSDSTSSVDNRFDYSSFRYLSGDGDDWILVGTLGVMAKFDFGLASDPGGFGALFWGEGYYGDNSINPGDKDVQLGDKWYITCHTASVVVGTDGKNYRCKLSHTSAADNQPITGINYEDFWEQGGMAGDFWVTGTAYDVIPIIGPAIADSANKGKYGPISTEGAYIGDHDTIYTVQLIDFKGYVQDFQNALLQISLASCTESWLDYWGSYFGIPRLLIIGGYEDDETYRARIMKEITRAKGTRSVLLEEAKAFFKSDLVTIEEYHQRGAASVVVGSDGFYYTCILNHTSASDNKPISGTNWATYWKLGGLAGDTWESGLPYVVETSPRWDGPVAPSVDCPAYGNGDPAKGLWPWQFYINIPAQRSPSAKFIKSGQGDAPRPCVCDTACYVEASCSCNVPSSYGATTCSCNNSCYGNVACTSCDGTVYGLATSCSCYNTCYQHADCACNNQVYGHGCTCNNTCYGYTPPGFGACGKDYWPGTSCSCDQTCYQESCSCHSTCYGYQCSCNSTCYQEGCVCNLALYGYHACICYNQCYGQGSPCTCNMSNYGASACSCENTTYHKGSSCTCDLLCYGHVACTCNMTNYGSVTCECDAACYGHQDCFCYQTCYQEGAAVPGPSLRAAFPTDAVAYLYEGGYGYYYGYGQFSEITSGPMFSEPTNEGDAIVFGCAHEFSGVEFIFSTPGVGGTYIWEYWDGSKWVALTIQDSTTKGTQGLTQNGYINWLQGLKDWTKADNIPYNIPNTGTALYWARCRVLTVPSTTPIISEMWLTYAGQTCRGTYIAHGTASCKCDSSCYGYSPCQCDLSMYGRTACNCYKTCYGHSDCACDSECYQESSSCTCNIVQYGYVKCTCDHTCYSESCTCNGSCYGYTAPAFGGCKGDYSPGTPCSCDKTAYGHSCSCDATCDKFSCTCNAVCYQQGTHGCVCDSSNYGFNCSCDTGCYTEPTGTCLCDAARYGAIDCYCNATCYSQVAATYNPLTTPKRDLDDCYIYYEQSFAKPTVETGLQDIVDRLKTAGTIAIINPLD